MPSDLMREGNGELSALHVVRCVPIAWVYIKIRSKAVGFMIVG
jgi:hypothetical protein